ncbi:MAG: Mth938-like domain-containing protein [Planctomycetota bacterium]|jgi:hypothetical protein
MYVDSYKFGKVVVDGSEYNSDCIIIGQQVHPDWWRKSGHLLSIEDLDMVIGAKPEILIIGTGASGIMKVPKQILDHLQKHDIETKVMKTSEAVKRYNELSETGTDVAAALHLTC